MKREVRVHRGAAGATQRRPPREGPNRTQKPSWDFFSLQNWTSWKSRWAPQKGFITAGGGIYRLGRRPVSAVDFPWSRRASDGRFRETVEHASKQAGEGGRVTSITDNLIPYEDDRFARAQEDLGAEVGAKHKLVIAISSSSSGGFMYTYVCSNQHPPHPKPERHLDDGTARWSPSLCLPLPHPDHHRG